MTPGNPNAAQTSYASNYQNVAPGIHPSEPNYIWQQGGSNFGVVGNDDDPYANNGNSNPSLNTNVKLIAATGNNPASLAALLQAQYGTAGWKSYQEDMQYTGLSVPTVSASGTIPGGGTNPYNGSTLYDFALKHDGTLFYTATNGGTLSGPGPTDSTNTEAAYYAPLAGSLAMDLMNNTVAKYNLITPDLYNDMHTGLPGGFTYKGVIYPNPTPMDPPTIKRRSRRATISFPSIIPQIMASQAYQNNGAIVITFDETEGGDTSAFTLPEIVISPLAKGNAYNSTVTLHPLFRPEEHAGTLWRVGARWRVPGRCEHSEHERPERPVQARRADPARPGARRRRNPRRGRVAQRRRDGLESPDHGQRLPGGRRSQRRRGDRDPGRGRVAL